MYSKLYTYLLRLFFKSCLFKLYIDDILQVLENRHTMMRYAKQCIYLIYLQNLQSLDSQDLAGRRSISPIRSPIAAAAAVKGPADHLPLAVSPNFNFKDVDTTYVGASAIGNDINVLVLHTKTYTLLHIKGGWLGCVNEFIKKYTPVPYWSQFCEYDAYLGNICFI